jgi:hypothetical protein
MLTHKGMEKENFILMMEVIIKDIGKMMECSV